MFRLTTLTTLLLLLQFFEKPVSACAIGGRASDDFIIGNDPPADPATIGYTINHFSLVANNITASVDFYGRILGMRHVFTFHASPEYQVTYLGHSQGGKNGTGYQTGEELLREKTNTGGLIELLYFKGTNGTIEASTRSPNTFGHVGLIVPDIQATQSRMEDNGVNILKRVGEDLAVEDGPVARAFGLGGDVESARVAALAGIRGIGFNGFLIITDPDGNLIEVQPQTS
ncbi:hypothetical protein JX265_010019 [Neoarthrinium moseri]|uniref:VOC domain-containing protein n=1 Tax=Neoarthrinium moseri TaxID=1658444 RepID=A0A9Q0AIP6_9PEZI|nr:uncharacterized protein JN550_012047 [Neoarthrinium moseri]KAI1844486.1 hypothetical protein JX266_009373 [Neoarthrinium moseri]KAI1859529.1 hypothetical protein JN550_012047 [Neoarthrinium moseri]KAI1860095.1 hypothetical protein JX265_010019 [Neoarthrinium moseri]